QSLERFKKRDPYIVSWENPDPNAVQQFEYMRRAVTDMGIKLLTIDKRLEPPVLRWGVLIGDIVHNLASALDNLVWELAQANPHPPPFPVNGKAKDKSVWTSRQRTISFPYCDDIAQWQQVLDRCLFFVEPSLHTIFEQA